MMMSSVSDVVMVAKAAPMITATARSSTLPRATKSRKSLSIFLSPVAEPKRNAYVAPDAFAKEWLADAHPSVCRDRRLGGDLVGLRHQLDPHRGRDSEGEMG